MNRQNIKGIYTAPEVEVIRLSAPRHLLSEMSLILTADFDDLTNQDDWYPEGPTD